MNKKNIPFHRYSDTHKHVSIINGNPALSIDPDFPFVLTQFNYMEHEALSAQLIATIIMRFCLLKKEKDSILLILKPTTLKRHPISSSQKDKFIFGNTSNH